jgi:hypothetical protein
MVRNGSLNVALSSRWPVIRSRSMTRSFIIVFHLLCRQLFPVIGIVEKDFESSIMGLRKVEDRGCRPLRSSRYGHQLASADASIKGCEKMAVLCMHCNSRCRWRSSIKNPQCPRPCFFSSVKPRILIYDHAGSFQFVERKPLASPSPTSSAYLLPCPSTVLRSICGLVYATWTNLFPTNVVARGFLVAQWPVNTRWRTSSVRISH